jgi:hypothetical protein
MQKSLIFILLIFASLALANPEDAVFVIVKLSYNTPGDKTVVGGVCGTAFLIDSNTVLTAHHVINAQTMVPNSGYKHCQFWLLKRGKNKIIIPFENVSFEYFPNIETSKILLNSKIDTKDQIKIKPVIIKIGKEVYSIGHVGGSMPQMDAEWIDYVLVIHDYWLRDGNKSDRAGKIVRIFSKTENAPDVKIDNICLIEPSFKAIHGMSGGPLLTKKGNNLIGLMSFGFPADSINKDTVFAISINEIVKSICPYIKR